MFTSQEHAPTPPSGADLGRFAPPSLRRALGMPGAGPAVEAFQAAVLFADVSGFTALATAMAARGQAGAEALTEHLDRCFGEALRLVHACGGEVEKFAGDALLAVFRAQPADPAHPADAADPADAPQGLREAVRRAAGCARAIARRLDGRQAGEVALGVHVGVGAGTLAGVHAQASDTTRAYVLLGEPLAQIGPATARAGKGEVCLSPQALALAGAGWEDAAAAPPAGALEPPAWDAATAAPYVNLALRERLAVVGDAHWVAELRRVTVLFIHLGPVPADAAAEGPRVARLARTIGHQAVRFHGLLHDILCDDKGLIAIVAFGVRQAHEDDAPRGLRAALELHAALWAVDGPPSIGVATGRVYCGVVGDAWRSELAVVGEPMNLAARLMGAAAGGVLCCAATAAEAGERFVFEEVAASDPKNAALPLQALKPARSRSAQPRAAAVPPPALIGREQPWTSLLGAITRHQAHPVFAATVVQGEAGIGKTALLGHLAGTARARGLHLLRIGCNAIDQMAPYQACTGLAAELLGLDLAAPAEQQAMQIQGRLSLLPAVAHLAPLLGAMLPAAPPETEALRGLDARSRAESTRALLLALLAHAAGALQTLLLVEDAQWLDASSWALLAQIAQRRLPLLVVLSARPSAGDAGTALEDFVRDARAERIVLGPLAPAGSAAMVRAKLGVARLSPGVEALVHERAAGHPFFTEALTLALRDAGLLRVEGDLCVLASSERSAQALPIPDTLEHALTSRIDSLAPPQRMVLKVASVLGSRFHLGLLAQIYPLPAERAALPGHLAALCAHEFLVDLGEGAYSFHHALTCEAGYALLPFAQRRDLHRAVAQALERGDPAEVQHRAPLLAHHWGHAQVVDKALAAAEEAALQALGRFANREAVHFLCEALRFDAALAQRSAAPRAARWEMLLGRAHRALGETEASRRSLEAALRRMDCALPARTPRARLRLVRHLMHMLLRKPALPRAAPAAAAAGAASTTIVDAYNLLAMLSHYANDVEAMLFCTAHASEHARHAPASIEVATLYGSIAHMAAFSKLFGASRRYVAAAHAVAAQVDSPFCTATVCQYTGHLAACLGDLQAFGRDMQRALALYAQAGKGRHWEEALINLSYLDAFQGELPRALQSLQLLEQSGRSRNDSQTAGWGIVGQGRVLLQQGRLEDALARLVAAEASTSDSLTWSELHGNRALVHWRLGHPEAALADAVRTVEIAERTPSTSYTTLPGYAAAMETLVQICLGPQPPAPARPAAERMLRAFTRYAGQFPIAAAQRAVWAGAMAAVRGQPGAARRAWARALPLARGSAVRVDEPAALRWMAHAQAGPERAATLRRAAVLYEAIGWTFEAAQARADAAAAEPSAA